MRVLWFTNIPLPQVAAAAGQGNTGSGGHWMTELFRAVVTRPGISLGVATAFPGIPDLQFEQDSATFYGVGQRRRSSTYQGSGAELEKCARIVRDFGPDLIHFHGSERFFGLLKANGIIRTPAVVSMQGLLGPYSEFRNFFGALSAWDIVRSTRPVEIPLRLGLLWQYADLRRGARQESRILGAVEGLLGRTDWDRAHAAKFYPHAGYCTVGEILRRPFYSTRWSLESCERDTLIYSNAGSPRRGTENLLAAAALIRPEFPGLRLRLAGVISERSGYGRYLRRRIRTLGLASNVEFLGHLDGDAMARELARSHVFVISSYIENSPNSLAEAMLIGMPCVASCVGGIPSMVDDPRTGLLYPVDDIGLLADRLCLLLGDDPVAARMGAAAREAALVRHDPETVTDQLLAAYVRFAGIGQTGDGGGQ